MPTTESGKSRAMAAAADGGAATPRPPPGGEGSWCEDCAEELGSHQSVELGEKTKSRETVTWIFRIKFKHHHSFWPT